MFTPVDLIFIMKEIVHIVFQLPSLPIDCIIVWSTVKLFWEILF